MLSEKIMYFFLFKCMLTFLGVKSQNGSEFALKY